MITHAAAAKLAVRSPSDRDCCVYALDVLTRTYDLEAPDPELRALWMIYPDEPSKVVPTSRVWGPITASAEVGIAEATGPLLPQPGRWYLCQGWRSLQPDGRAAPKLGDRGHTWLWFAATPELGVRVDSARASGPTIHGWGTWTSLRSTYQAGIQLALLRRPRRKG